jgi:hypothetical protein
VAVDEFGCTPERVRERVGLGAELDGDRRGRQRAERSAGEQAPRPGNVGHVARSSLVSGAPSLRLKCRPSATGARAMRSTAAADRQPGAVVTHDAAFSPPAAASTVTVSAMPSTRPTSSAQTATMRPVAAVKPEARGRRPRRCRGGRGRPAAA